MIKMPKGNIVHMQGNFKLLVVSTMLNSVLLDELIQVQSSQS